MTFSGAVALSEVSLATGTYAFELADPNESNDAVVVRNGERNHVYLLGLTQRIERPLDLPANRVVTFGESIRGIPRPISAWYPMGESRGYQFVYGGR
ncbi:MAG: hypothetical protein DMG01_04750 [Acidobacteria bacterium]|nr:MAG: hypothetical protein DMG01_04750 [Acidobacteriota bacterium]